MIYWIIPYSALGLAAVVMFATVFLMLIPQDWMPKPAPPRIPKLLPARTETVEIDIVDEIKE